MTAETLIKRAEEVANQWERACGSWVEVERIPHLTLARKLQSRFEKDLRQFLIEEELFDPGLAGHPREATASR